MKNCPNCFATNSYKKVYKEDKNIYVCEYCGSVSEDYTKMKKIMKKNIVKAKNLSRNIIIQKIEPIIIERLPHQNGQKISINFG